MEETSKEIVPKSWLADDQVYDFWRKAVEGLTSHEISLLCAGLNPYHLSVLFPEPGFLREYERFPKEVNRLVETADDISFRLEKHTDCSGRRSTAEWFWAFRELDLLDYFPVRYRLDLIALDSEWSSLGPDDLEKPRLSFLERRAEFDSRLDEAVRAERERADYAKGMVWRYLEYDSWKPYEAICLLADLDVIGPGDGESEDLENFQLPSPAPLYLEHGISYADIFEALAERPYHKLSQEEQIRLTIGRIHLDRWGTLRQKWIRDLSVPNDGLMPKEFYIDWALSKGIDVPWLDWAKGQGFFSATEKSVAEAEESISFRKETLLKVIVAMAMDAYGYKPGAARQTTALSESAGGIPYACASRGVSVDADTLRNILREAVELLPKPGS